MHSSSRSLCLALALVCLLFIPNDCAINQGGSEAIKAAIQSAIASAVKDGLGLIDAAMRQTYWYYLQGANQTTFNATILPDRLNYIIDYNNAGSLYQVNCDLIKVTWLPRLNSFVRLSSNSPPNAPPSSQTTPTTAINLTTQASLDLSAINATINPPEQPAAKMVVITNLPQPSLTSDPSN